MSLKSIVASNQPEIEEAQRELLRNRQLVQARQRLIRSETQHKLASPKALLIAAGSGFLLERISRKPRCKVCGKATLGLDVGNLLRILVRGMMVTRAVDSVSETFKGSE